MFPQLFLVVVNTAAVIPGLPVPHGKILFHYLPASVPQDYFPQMTVILGKGLVQGAPTPEWEEEQFWFPCTAGSLFPEILKGVS